MPLPELVAQIKERTHINDTELGTCAGVAPATIRWILGTREMPRHARVRERLQRFVELNQGARVRQELRFV